MCVYAILNCLPLLLQELRERQLVIHKLECEKLYLGEEIYRITGVEEGFWSDQTLVSEP